MAKARKTPRRGASRARSKPGRRVPAWLIAVCGLVLGLFIAFLFQLEPGRDTVKRSTAPPQPTTPPAPAKPAGPSYDFYTLLPESEVVVPKPRPEPPPPPAPKPPPAAKPESSTRYYLQAGSFRQRSEADRVRAQIILMGLDARLEDAKLANGETWHRVQVGPFADQSKRTQAEQTLSGNGFNNLLRQQRTTTP
ncbi:Cell division protein FtsN [Halopseudomonas litoralis]|uniref:Cell division protein FtsN n=1 Tax=Halopseudomonas litoralis TaxID=797277 RepID=A0A1H1XR15_9GAMM|nr:SPOR domain-containing protein [Halopseudomonas litoralis]SDT11707.1 Cell division protein FtsN [Halopseudomonas litoralis]